MNMTRPPDMNASKISRRHGGFTLVEVLVSLVILSVGLLGMAKMALVSAHANDSAYLRSQATALAYQMLDSMRANAPAATAHNYDTALGVTPGPPTSCLGTGLACSNLQLALWDVYTWKRQLLRSIGTPFGALPQGTGSVVTSATVPVTATITVQWDDAAGSDPLNAALGGTPTGAAVPMQIVLETVLQ